MKKIIWPENWNLMNYPENILKRFWDNVKIPESWNDHPELCWEWQTTSDYWGGYYQFYIQYRQQIRIQKFVYECCNGEIPPRKIIFKTCKNQRCVNPLHLYTSQDLEKAVERFWTKVNIKSEDECWEWQASKSEDGYGQFGFNNNQVTATRFIYEYKNGQIKDNNLICHTCDNPSCVNPKHLFEGTPSDNSKDMIQKERVKKGSQCHLAILTENDIMNMLNEIWGDELKSVQSIMEKYNISDPNVRDILNGKTWKHVISKSKISLKDIKAKVIKSVLNPEKIIDIRNYIAKGESDKKISKKFGIGHETVRAIRLGKSWKNI